MCHGRPGNPGVAARQEQESRQRSSGLKIHHAATTRGPQYDDSSCDRPAARSMPQQFVIAPRECRAMPQHFVIAPRECRAMPPHFVIAPRECRARQQHFVIAPRGCRARQQHFVIAPRGCRAIEGKHSTEGSTIIKQRFGKWRDSCSQVSCFRFQTFNSKLSKSQGLNSRGFPYSISFSQLSAFRCRPASALSYKLSVSSFPVIHSPDLGSQPSSLSI